MYHSFIGIDIGKKDFYLALHGESNVTPYPNNKKGFALMVKRLKAQLPDSLVVLENTGGYEAKLISYLLARDIKVHRADTRKVKHFIRSTGRLGKSDNIDALGLARYAKERHHELDLYQELEENAKKLLMATNRREELKQILVQEKNRLKAPDNEHVKDSHITLIHFLEQEISKVEQVQKSLIALDKELQNKVNLLKDEIDGVGEVTAINLISTLPELGTLNRRKIASLAGTAPHPYESGNKIGYRNVRGGRGNVKRILFMAALTASRSKGKLGQFYKRLIANGKKPMVAMTALMRKIVVIANAKIKDMLRKTQAQSLTTERAA